MIKYIHNPKICLELTGVRRKFSWGFHSVAYGGNLFVVCGLCVVTI